MAYVRVPSAMARQLQSAVIKELEKANLPMISTHDKRLKNFSK